MNREWLRAHKTPIKNALWAFVRFLLLVGLSFVIIYPFLAKVSSMFMSTADLRDNTVWFIPRRPTLLNIRNVLYYGDYWHALRNTGLLSGLCALLQTASCTVIAYGLAKFRFRGRNLLLVLTVLTIVIPPQTIYISLYTKFRYFDVWGLLSLLGLTPLNLTESVTPMAILSATGLGLKNGLYILMLMQLFRNLPHSLSEAAYVDGAGVMRTFWQINMPQARPMMVSVFLLSFAWQWTDTFYSDLFFRQVPLLKNTLTAVSTVTAIGAVNGNALSGTLKNTAVILAILPLLAVYLFGQRFLIQGVERTGMVG